MKQLILILNTFVFFLSFSCKAQESVSTIRFPNGKICLLLDSTAAGTAITTDVWDGYFEKVNASEISIQMHKPLEAGHSRESLLSEYIQFLKTDVEGFSAEDTKFIQGVMEKVFQTVSGVSPELFPDTLKLIKTKGRHYGDGVWYTRDNCIIIPADELGRRKTNGFSTTVYHELFHVWSRLHPKGSDRAYQLIGFEELGYENLNVSPNLAARVMFNPDGVDFAQKIALTQTDGSSIFAVPIIYANHEGWTEVQKTFFDYLKFNLFRIEKQADGRWNVVVADDGLSSTLDLKSQPDFFRQIKDNTGYIIHPDEVLADNFAFIMQEKNGQQVSLKFSAEGKKLMADLEEVLKGK